tara:strand:- start:171 stop:584 length:414 start_codon:yes stop_codon:yes gene_type:complete
MFKIEALQNIYNLLKKNKLNEANKFLIQLRGTYFINPDYLFLMSLMLSKTSRIYLSIDTMLLSLLVDNSPEVLIKHKHTNSSEEVNSERFKILIILFKKINITDLADKVETAMEKNDSLELLSHINKIMPGIRINNK